jgi:adenylate kinase
VFSLNAPDDFLRARILALPEAEVASTHNTQEGFARRLALYRELNNDESSVLDYFDELEIHPIGIGLRVLLFSFEKQTKKNLYSADVSAIGADGVITQLETTLGAPRHYGPTAEEAETLEKETTARNVRMASAVAEAEVCLQTFCT